MSNDLDTARAEARWIYHLYSKRRDEMKVLADLPPEVLEVLQILLGQGSDAADEVGKLLRGLRAEPKNAALAAAMAPLVRCWEAENGPVATTTKAQNPTGKGASDGIRFLVDEMNKFIDGPAIHDETVKNMLVNHLRK